MGENFKAIFFSTLLKPFQPNMQSFFLKNAPGDSPPQSYLVAFWNFNFTLFIKKGLKVSLTHDDSESSKCYSSYSYEAFSTKLLNVPYDIPHKRYFLAFWNFNLNFKKHNFVAHGNKSHMELECLIDLRQMGRIGVDVFMGVYSLWMAHHHRQTQCLDPRTSCFCVWKGQVGRYFWHLDQLKIKPCPKFGLHPVRHFGY